MSAYYTQVELGRRTKLSVDLKLDAMTRDLVATPSNDIALVSGEDAVEQRIRVCLRIPLGSWLLDPTGGALGSTLGNTTRLPVNQAVFQIPLVVKEALTELPDIRVEDVVAAPDPDYPSRVGFTITYAVVDSDGEGEIVNFNDFVEIA